MNRYAYILNIVDACSDMEFGAWIKLLVVPLAGWCNALDLAPQLPPVAVHVILVMVKSVERCLFNLMYVLVYLMFLSTVSIKKCHLKKWHLPLRLHQ